MKHSYAMTIAEKLDHLRKELPAAVTLVAVSKTHPASAVREAYDAGQRGFGESRPQEMTAKYQELPKDIRWHFIGRLQTNKVKYIAPYVTLIHSVDSEKLMAVIRKEAAKNGREIDVLMEVHIAREETKSGWSEEDLLGFFASGRAREYPGVRVRGVMGMATYTDDERVMEAEFDRLRTIFDSIKARFFPDEPSFDTVSMGMTGDYPIAVRCGSTMVRIGSYLFGER